MGQRTKKDRMGELEADEGKLTCSRGSMWPPMTAVVYGPTSLEARPHITNAEYHAIRIWERACGLMKMSPDKCPDCPYVMVDGKMKIKPGNKGPAPKTTKANQVTLNRKKKAEGG